MFVSVLILSLLIFPVRVVGDSSFSADFFHFAERTWNSSNGLPHDSVTSIYVDDYGYLWAGTAAGLARVDSKNSEIFDTNSEKAIFSNKINDLTGCGNRVFVATDAGISEISDFGAKITNYLESSVFSDVESLSDCTLFALGKDEIIVMKSGKISKLNAVGGLPYGTVYKIFSDASSLYVGYKNGGIYSYKNSVFSQNLCPENSDAVTSGYAAKGTVFFGTSNGQIFKISDKKCGLFLQTASKEAVDSIDFYGDTMVFASDGEIFFVEKNEKIVPCGAFCKGSGQNKIVKKNNNFLWLAGSKGASVFYRGKFVTLGRESGLTSEKVYALLEGDDSKIWVGTRGGGLFYFENEKFYPVKNPKGTISRVIGGLFQDDSSTVFVGTPFEILEISPKNHFNSLQTSKNEYPKNVSAIFQDRKGRIWAGSSDGEIYMRFKNAWQLIRKVGNSDSDFVSAIADDKEGNLWFSTSVGLLKLDENDEFREIAGIDASFAPLSLFIDDRAVFVGSMHRGLAILFPDSTTARIDSRKGLCSDTIFGIIDDEFGNLWFSSKNGIFSIPKKAVIEAALNPEIQLHCTVYNSTDGIRSTESTGGVQPSVLRRKNGDLWFPTFEGIAVFRRGNENLPKFDTLPPEFVQQDDALIEKKDGFAFIMFFVLFFLVVGSAVLFFVLKRRKISCDKTKVKSQVFFEKNDAESEVIENIKEKIGAPGNYDDDSVEFDEEKSETEQKCDAEIPENLSECEEKSALGREEESEIRENAENFTEIEESSEYSSEVDENTEENGEDFYESAAEDSDSSEYEVYKVYFEELKTLIEAKELYKDTTISLPKLAEMLNLSVNVLSKVINGCYGSNFYTFINTYRAEAVIAMMKDPENDRFSLLALALEAGFKSKSTFNSFFKAYTGFTPKEYRRNLKSLK